MTEEILELMSEIEAAARNAVSGSWHTSEMHGWSAVCTKTEEGWPYVVLQANTNFEQDARRNIEFVLAAQPSNVMAMVEHIRELYSIVTHLTIALEECRQALEPYDNLSPRDLKADRWRLRAACRTASETLEAVRRQR